jgi:CrcB protein
MKLYLAVGLAGAVGSVLRYLVSLLVPVTNAASFPYSTFIVNMSGSFLLCFITLIFMQSPKISDSIKASITVGLLGSFTTFSTFSLETMAFIRNKLFIIAGLYAFLSLIGGLFMAYLGWVCAKAYIERKHVKQERPS